MKRLIVGMLVLLVLGTVGCTQFEWNPTNWTPTAKLAAARESFNGAVDALTVFRKAGAFDKQTARELTTVIHVGKRTLDRWQAAIELGQPPTGCAESMAHILRELVAARIAAENAVPEPPPATTSHPID